MNRLVYIVALAASLAFLSLSVVSPAISAAPGTDPACDLAATKTAHPGWYRDGGYCTITQHFIGVGFGTACLPIADPVHHCIKPHA